jgi:hypothetical protein
MFGTKTATINRRPEALADFRLALDKAIAEARHWQVHRVDLADLLESHATQLRVAQSMRAA